MIIIHRDLDIKENYKLRDSPVDEREEEKVWKSVPLFIKTCKEVRYLKLIITYKNQDIDRFIIFSKNLEYRDVKDEDAYLPLSKLNFITIGI